MTKNEVENMMEYEEDGVGQFVVVSGLYTQFYVITLNAQAEDGAVESRKRFWRVKKWAAGKIK